MAIELKSPSAQGILATKQASYLDVLKNINFFSVVSNDYDEIILEITKLLIKCTAIVFSM